MRTYHIGLDFGTYQTKACVFDLENSIHEFFRFPGTGNFFFPSKVGLKPDSTFDYGTIDFPNTSEYYYFKIASAEDEEFNAETFEDLGKTKAVQYKNAEFLPFTPEFLSVIYLCNVLFIIKDNYIGRNIKTAVKGGFLNKLFSSSHKPEELRFTVQLGIPTEWSQIKNLRRKRKFENILMVAELLQKKYKDHKAFLEATSTELIHMVRNIYVQHQPVTTNEFYSYLNQLGISVFPETAAGLTFIVKTRQLLPGYYAIMDIGGGTTDISFFCIEPGYSIKYLASESYIIASNNVYKQLASNESSIHAIHEAEKSIQQIIRTGDWEGQSKLLSALTNVNKQLSKMVYKLFHNRVYYFKKGMVDSYNEQAIILYGGGSRLPIVNDGTILLHDNGSPNSITIPRTSLQKHLIDSYAAGINVLPEDGSWKKDLSVLVVALGLSYIKPEGSASWFKEDDYQPKDEKRTKPSKLGRWNQENMHEIPHPFNEGRFIYDVLSSKWTR